MFLSDHDNSLIAGFEKWQIHSKIDKLPKTQARNKMRKN